MVLQVVQKPFKILQSVYRYVFRFAYFFASELIPPLNSVYFHLILCISVRICLKIFNE